MTDKAHKPITGIHHITAIAGDTKENVAFYTGVLGLRMIKKTVNFDDPGVYHLYYADEQGTPGSVLTFFPYEGLRKGIRGNGQVSTTAFSVPLESLAYWEERFKRFGVHYTPVRERFGQEVYMYLEDKEGLGLELVFNDRDERKAWGGGPVPAEYAIRGFYAAEIWAAAADKTVALLTEKMNHQLIAQDGNRYRFAPVDAPGHYTDVVDQQAKAFGQGGYGTVHHIAYRTPDDDSQKLVREAIQRYGLHPTQVIDRQYFHSVYFREPGGVLFEIATDGPGFMVDEDLDVLGESLMLPPKYEGQRKHIDSILPEIQIDYASYH